MALRNEDKDWIVERIRATESDLRPRGWKKLQEFFPLAGVVGVFVALLGLVSVAWNYAFSRVEKETQFQTRTTDRLDRIEETLKLIPAQIASAKYSSVPAQELRAHRDELRAIKSDLAITDKSAPNFWPVSFEILTLLSRASSNPIVQSEHEGALNNVVSNPPGLIGEIANQRVVLINLVEGVTFRNSIIRFDPSVRLANDTFIDCVFVFPASMLNPPKPLQEIADALLKSDISRATITAS
jgi:hypothetical protein